MQNQAGLEKKLDKRDRFRHEHFCEIHVAFEKAM